MRRIRHILVPVDFSPPSKAALEFAVTLAERFDGSIDVLHVWEVPLYMAPEAIAGLPIKKGQSLEEFYREKVDVEMKAFLAAYTECKVPIREKILRGDSWRSILETAENAKHDLIVMGTHGRRGLERVLMGSVAEKIVARAPCPVVTVHGSSEGA
jgi:nucleotide-binding universal stress UspA family protein